MSLAGCQINPIDVNFYLQKSLESFVKNSANKIWSKKDKEIKVSPLMPIRLNVQFLTFLVFREYFSSFDCNPRYSSFHILFVSFQEQQILSSLKKASQFLLIF